MRKPLLDVYLPEQKEQIVQCIKRAGSPGISTRELMTTIYGGRQVSPHTIKSHIWQINDQWIDATPWIVRCEGRGPNARWYLARRRKGE